VSRKLATSSIAGREKLGLVEWVRCEPKNAPFAANKTFLDGDEMQSTRKEITGARRHLFFLNFEDKTFHEKERRKESQLLLFAC